jgi:hypothetical protein
MVVFILVIGFGNNVFNAPHPTSAQAQVEGQKIVSGTQYETKEHENDALDNNKFEFFPISKDEGWLLLRNQLFWLDDGKIWREITPPLFEDGFIEAVFFLNNQQGWVVSTHWFNSIKIFELHCTNDSGASWKKVVVNVPSQEPAAPVLTASEMQWINEEDGRLLLRKQTGNNFSQGILLSSEDGGITWKASGVPEAEKIIFIDENGGYLLGLNGSRLYQTMDGGSSWQEIGVGLHLIADSSTISFSLPAFSDFGFGILPIIEPASHSASQIIILGTEDSGKSWQAILTQPVNDSIDPQESATVSVVDQDNFSIWIPNTTKVFGLQDGAFFEVQIDSEDFNLTQLHFSDQDNYWGVFSQNDCMKEPIDDTRSEITCVEKQYIAISNDKGHTWQKIFFPSGTDEMMIQTESIMAHLPSTERLSSNTEVFIGQGFDKCEIPTLSQMQTWYDSSPYGAVNLYIGGDCRACPNSALDEDYVAQLHAQGWKFFPTWVGPQAPCTSFSTTMSWNTSTAYQQGVDNANDAVQVLSDLGLTLNDMSGSVVYYDIEAYSGTTACYDAVEAFMNGWTYQLHQLGNLSGVYGSSCGSHLSSFFGLSNPPDVIWPAAWYHSSGSGYYNPSATVWDVPCISNSSYDNHERIRQYEGGHNESWGGVSLGIDSNVLDGVVAVPNQPDTTPPNNPTSISPGCTANNGEWQNTCNNTNFSWSGASDSGSGVAGYQYYWGTSSTGTSTSYTTSTSYNPGAVGEGTRYFRIRTKDNAGNYAAWKTMFVLRYDGTTPTGSLSINSGNATTYKTLVTLDPTAADNLSGARYIRFRDQGGAWGDWQGIMDTNWVLPAITGQSYIVEAEVKDAAGNVSNVIMDDIALDIHLDRPASSNFTLLRSTFGMSSTNGASAGFTLNGTLSQPSMIGTPQSNNYQLASGYWSWLFELPDFLENYLPLIIH